MSRRIIAIATTTRADWGLLSPVASDLARKGADVRVIAGNMHLNPALGMTVKEIEADGFVPAALVPAEGNPAQVASATLQGFHDALARIKPDALLLLGDRYEMLSVALAATLLNVPIAHIAGGTVSEGATDDNIRHAITKLSVLHFPETELSRSRIIAMGESPERVIASGAIGVENALSVPAMPKEELEQSIGSRIESPTLLVTLHPATNDETSPAARMRSLIEALEDFPEAGIIITYPNNDVDPAPQISLIEDFARRCPDRVKAIPSLGRIRYLSALRYVDAVVGNSSSGLVEVPSAGIPTLDIGIRQQGRERGESVVHCEADAESIKEGIHKVLSPEIKMIAARKENPYFKPGTVDIISGTMLSFPFSGNKIKKFYTPPRI